MKNGQNPTEPWLPQQIESESALRGAACSRCGSTRQTLTCGGNPQLYHCGSSEKWQSTDCEYRCEINELQALADLYRSQRDGLAEAMQGIASGLYSWQCCVDEIAPSALVNFYSANV